ncbi:ABC transporter ATP-binding protein [Bradyrhizobium iriomotense]|uniref:ABC transporter ATP-binding protein n=1 Tax=Bradyrhizobium iriomotense TaxID=441950 RepID=UPI0024E0AF72|nr:ABC transporter ATP-binding protein [Bradyrhizobium iriomotense]
MTASRSHRLRLEAITHRFGASTAVRDINLDIAGGELVALLGPSGCGKSTLLRIISGFIRQTEGRVLFDDSVVDALSPAERGVGIVFQNYALFPHMSVGENVAYGLQAHKWPRERIGKRVAEMLDLVHMGEFASRKPRELSGGQQQRVALARCLAIDPKVLLLDEPFGALDKNLRLDMQIEVKRLQRQSGITTILVTHDQEEALSMADRIAVMSRGHIEQVSTPTGIYDTPQTLFVNEFVGTTNVLRGEFIEGPAVRLEHGPILPVGPDKAFQQGRAVVVSIRPEQLRFRPAPSDGAFAAVITTVLPLGAQVVYDVALTGGPSLKIAEPRDAEGGLRPVGATVYLAPASPAACNVFPAS